VEAAIMRRLALTEPAPFVKAPLTGTHYSNLAVGMLGRALEAAILEQQQQGKEGEEKEAGANSRSAIATISSYEEAVEQLILVPLGMGSSGFNSRLAQEMGFLADGVSVANGSQAVPLPCALAAEVGAPCASPWLAPAGFLYSTPADMAKFMIFVLDRAVEGAPSSGGNKAAAADDALLDHRSVREMLLPGLWHRDGRSAISRGTYEQVFTAGHWLSTKAGCIGGYRSDLVLVPELQLGLFGAMTSTCDIHGDGDYLTFPVANRLVPAVEAALRARPTNVGEQKKEGRRAAEQQERLVNDTSLVGQYTCGGKSTLNVTLEDVGLAGEAAADATTSLVLRNYDSYYPFVLSFLGSEVIGAAAADPLRLETDTDHHGAGRSKGGHGARQFGRQLYAMEMLGDYLSTDYPGCSSSSTSSSDVVPTCPTTCPCRMARGDGEVATFHVAVPPADGNKGSSSHRNGSGGLGSDAGAISDGQNQISVISLSLAGLEMGPCLMVDSFGS
jgi:hypothetical protein